MSRVYNFSDFEKKNEGLSTNIIAGLTSLLMSTGIYAQTPKDHGGKHKTILTKLKSEEDLSRYKKNGWTLTNTQIDTLYDEVSIKCPDAHLIVDSIRIPFESGQFKLTREFTDHIKSNVDELKKKGSVLIGVDLVSSTDKKDISAKLKKILIEAGFSGDNIGLSKARSSNIVNFLKEIDIDESLITELNKHSLGSKSGDSEFRYVYLNFELLISEESFTKEMVPRIETTYTMVKDSPEPQNLKVGGIFDRIFNIGKVKKIQKGRKIPCPRW